jgi:hypothetical protein
LLIADLIRAILPNREAEYFAIALDYRGALYDQKDINARLVAEIERMKLEHARTCRDLIEAFLTAHSDPERQDIRDRLIDALVDFDDEVARLEEHMPV